MVEISHSSIVYKSENLSFIRQNIFNLLEINFFFRVRRIEQILNNKKKTNRISAHQHTEKKDETKRATDF